MAEYENPNDITIPAEEQAGFAPPTDVYYDIEVRGIKFRPRNPDDAYDANLMKAIIEYTMLPDQPQAEETHPGIGAVVGGKRLSEFLTMEGGQGKADNWKARCRLLGIKDPGQPGPSFNEKGEFLGAGMKLKCSVNVKMDYLDKRTGEKGPATFIKSVFRPQ